MTIRIPTTHVGSLPRPTDMIKRTLRKETISSEDLTAYVLEVLERQLSLGITSINNGELPRADYINATVKRLSGYNDTGIAPFPKDMEEVPEYSRKFSSRNGLITLNEKAQVTLPACSSELGYRGEDTLKEELDQLVECFEKAKAKNPGSEAHLFFTAPSPGTIALFLENHHYPDYRTYLEKLGEALQKEYEIIDSYGVTLQIDCPDLAMGRHTAYKTYSEKEFLSLMETNIAVLNRALANIDPSHCRAHVCWGNYPGTHHCDIELKTIYPFIMKLRPRYLSIESSNHRHAHEAELFRSQPFPDDKVLLPGVVDTSSNYIEHPDLVAQRLLGFTSALGPERVMGSTDCGFASTSSASSVGGEIAWLKLGALVEGARRAGEKL